jgi:1,4-dihydroxy-2-naphthoate octaprenyltransferase
MVFLAVVPLALLQFNMLLSVHLPDVESDAAVAKRTLVVILGRQRTGCIYQINLIATYLSVPFLMLAGLPTAVGLSLFVPSPLAIWLFWRLRNGHALIPAQWDSLAFWTIGLLMATGVLETIAFLFIA